MKRVKIALIEKGVKQVFIVAKYGFDKGDVSKVINGVRKTPAIREAIATEVGVPADLLFAPETLPLADDVVIG